MDNSVNLLKTLTDIDGIAGRDGSKINNESIFNTC